MLKLRDAWMLEGGGGGVGRSRTVVLSSNLHCVLIGGGGGGGGSHIVFLFSKPALRLYTWGLRQSTVVSSAT